MDRGGVIVLPAFAVERTQDVLLAIAQIQARNSNVAGLQVYLDSPMAERVDEVFAAFPDAHKPLPCPRASDGFGVKNFSLVRSTDESKRLNSLRDTALIVSASGMAAGGRVLHHLHRHIADRRSTVIFVGYQSRGTLGYAVTHGAKTLRLLGDVIQVQAAVVELQGFSGHADEHDFSRWFATCTGAPHLYAVHGEPESASALASFVRTKLGWDATPAQRGVTVSL